MTPEQFHKRMYCIWPEYEEGSEAEFARDIEKDHLAADALMCEVLESLG